MKKFTSVLLVVLMMALLFSSCGKPSPEGDISGYAEKVSVIGREVPSFTLRENGIFMVLQISDTHIISGTTKNDKKTLESIRDKIEGCKPDLVVVSGDMVEGNNKNSKFNKKTALETIGNMFEELSQYWAYVPGNNDGEFMGTTADVAAFLSQYEHCILSNEENLTGATQYSVDLKDSDGKTVHSLIFLDSLARDENNKYDYMKEDQVEWAKQTVESKIEENPDVFVSFFFHMNTPNFALSGKDGTAAYSEGFNYSPVPSDFYTGIDGNKAFDEMTESLGNVGLVSIGHIHPDRNYCSVYNDTFYHVTRSAGFGVTKDPGCTLIAIQTKAGSTKYMYSFLELPFQSKVSI